MADKIVQALSKPRRQETLTSYEPTFREKASDVLRALLFSDDREGQRKAERLSNVLETVTPYGVATGIDDMREAVGQGDYATAGMMGAMAMVPGPSPKIRAYHGSPHSFDRFDMSKIGTGEGAQAYGHGLYFAENEGVAKSYRDALAVDPRNEINKLIEIGQNFQGDVTFDAIKSGEVARRLGLSDEQVSDILTAIHGRNSDGTVTDEAMRAYRRLDRSMQPKNPGSMYEVNINASPDDFLDWDKPAPQNHPFRKKLEELGLKAALSKEPNASAIGRAALTAARTPNSTGADLYLRWGAVLDVNRPNLEAKYGQQALDLPVEELGRLEAGIPGIKYLDAGSRGKGDGSRNYVVFDDKLIEIVRKYGIAGASAMMGYNLMDSVDPAQAKQLEQLEQVRKLDAMFGGAR